MLENASVNYVAKPRWFCHLLNILTSKTKIATTLLGNIILWDHHHTSDPLLTQILLWHQDYTLQKLRGKGTILLNPTGLVVLKECKHCYFLLLFQSHRFRFLLGMMLLFKTLPQFFLSYWLLHTETIWQYFAFILSYIYWLHSKPAQL